MRRTLLVLFGFRCDVLVILSELWHVHCSEMLLECLIMPWLGLSLALDLLLLMLLVSLSVSEASPKANFLARARNEDILLGKVLSCD